MHRMEYIHNIGEERKNTSIMLTTVRLIALMLAALFMLTSCSNSGVGGQDQGNEDVKIVTTVFAAYDWATEVSGGKTDVTYLMDNGTDLHSYEPNVNDMAKISDADVFIYVGGESEEWVSDALKNKRNPDMMVICLMDVLKDRLRDEEVVEGMIAEDEEVEDSDSDAQTEEGHDGKDEHIWLSIKNAKVCVSKIAKEIQKKYEEQFDAEQAKALVKKSEANVETYKEELDKLDKDYKNVVADASKENPDRALIVADRFPFLYLAKDYGIKYYAAFSGCYAETEASFSTITFLAEKAAGLGAPAVLMIDGSNGDIAEAVINNTKEDPKPELLMLDSLQSVNKDDIEAGKTYLSGMKYDLEILKKALN